MARPPLPIGTWGAIRRVEKGPKLWTAYARFRDYDGNAEALVDSGTALIGRIGAGRMKSCR